MKLTVKDKKILNAFGCPNLEATINRLRLIGTLSPAPETRRAMFALALKLTSAKSQQDYQDFYYIPKLYTEEYHTKATQISQFQLPMMEDDDDETDES